MSSLDKIADALVMPLTYHHGEVSGESKVKYTPLPSLSIPINPTALRVAVDETVAVLAHVVGDLYILVSSYPVTGGVSAFLLDTSKVEGDILSKVSKKAKLVSILTPLKDSVVASFLWKGGKWTPLKLSI